MYVCQSLVACVEMLREQKADRDEVLDGLRDKVCQLIFLTFTGLSVSRHISKMLKRIPRIYRTDILKTPNN